MLPYFAYGSNMSRRQMQQRCPGHECLGRAVLKDHALCFPIHSVIRNCGVAGLVAQTGAEVWGVVYRLPDADMAALDRREGYDPARSAAENRYNRRTVRVLMDGNILQCVTYFATPEPGEHIPSAAYLGVMLEGASENGLPADYIARLQAIGSLCPRP